MLKLSFRVVVLIVGYEMLALKLISAIVTTLSLWKTYGQQSSTLFCMLWSCTYRW